VKHGAKHHAIRMVDKMFESLPDSDAVGSRSEVIAHADNVGTIDQKACNEKAGLETRGRIYVQDVAVKD
jgi:hypothetical protein